MEGSASPDGCAAPKAQNNPSTNKGSTIITLIANTSTVFKAVKVLKLIFHVDSSNTQKN